MDRDTWTFSFSHNQRNANLNKVRFSAIKSAQFKKKTKPQRVFTSCSRSVNSTSCSTVMCNKVDNRLSSNSTLSNPTEITWDMHDDVYWKMFITELFVSVKSKNNPKCSTMEKWLHNLWNYAFKINVSKNLRSQVQKSKVLKNVRRKISLPPSSSL